MTWAGAAWVALAYLVGTIPSALLAARAAGAAEVLAAASRTRSELDAHILLTRHAGARWSALAAAADVLKALAVALAARWSGPEPAWQAAAGVALVAGYCWPPYASRFAGRGLAVAAGVYLGLLPLSALVFGLIVLGGVALGATGLWSTVALASVPLTAALLGEPGPLVLMAAAILALVLLRRLEGVGRSPSAQEVWRRLLLDSPSQGPSRW